MRYAQERRSSMKKGEYYRHKWNKYVSKIIDMKHTYIELKTINSGVTEFIHPEYFNQNYTPCITIYHWQDTIKDIYDFADEVIARGDTIRVRVNDSILDFSVNDVQDEFKVYCSDDIKEAYELDYNVTRFLLEDADEIIPMFADFFIE